MKAFKPPMCGPDARFRAPDRMEDRRGIRNVFVIKIAGAACDEGYWRRWCGSLKSQGMAADHRGRHQSGTDTRL
ncbi:hypothetical protein [Enterocloster sp.]|uniref:hypothetical protein n=1 Tax=Enterocloster sp. TaxID=2719315 RepID=UPI0039A25E40